MTLREPYDLLLPIHAVPDISLLRIDAVQERYPDGAGALSAAEQDVYATLVGQRRRASFVAGRLAAKLRAAALCGGPEAGDEPDWRNFEIRRTPTGSTELHADGCLCPGLHVSISHGGQYAAASVARHRPAGVDVEPISRRCTAARDTFSTDTEVARIREFFGPGFSEDEAYTRLFSAKETAAKCLRTHMYFAFHYYRLHQIVDIGPAQHWTLEDRSSRRAVPVITSALFGGHVVSSVSGDRENCEERSSP